MTATRPVSKGPAVGSHLPGTQTRPSAVCAAVLRATWRLLYVAFSASPGRNGSGIRSAPGSATEPGGYLPGRVGQVAALSCWRDSSAAHWRGEDPPVYESPFGGPVVGHTSRKFFSPHSQLGIGTGCLEQAGKGPELGPGSHPSRRHTRGFGALSATAFIVPRKVHQVMDPRPG